MNFHLERPNDRQTSINWDASFEVNFEHMLFQKISAFQCGIYLTCEGLTSKSLAMNLANSLM